jgi:hypothetical protein
MSSDYIYLLCRSLVLVPAEKVMVRLVDHSGMMSYRVLQESVSWLKDVHYMSTAELSTCFYPISLTDMSARNIPGG